MKKQTYNQSGDSYMGLKNPYFSRLIFINISYYGKDFYYTRSYRVY